MPESARTTSPREARREDLIDFGDVPPAVNVLLQRGVAAYRVSKAAGEALFLEALALAPDVLPVYFCLYKIHTYGGRLDAALGAARAGLGVAARQAGWPESFREWPTPVAGDTRERFALYTLKALAFIRLKRGETREARCILERLEVLDPQGQVGWRVIAELLEGLAS